MIRLLLALFAFQASAAEPGSAVDAERSKLRPSVTEISRRVLTYAAKNDSERAQKAVKVLAPLHKELDAVNPSTTLAPLLPALTTKDLAELQCVLNEFVLTDMRHLLDHLSDPVKKNGLAPRTRILLAQKNLHFLRVSIPKDKHGREVNLALDKLFRLLSDTVPHQSEYGKADTDWAKAADFFSVKLLLLLDATIPKPASSKKGVTK